MTIRTDNDAHEGMRPDFAEEIRNTLNRLEELNRETAGYLKTLAFILHRVAIADNEVSAEEVERMEQILVDHASLSRSEAVLTVEIARHCGEVADCGCRYEASRSLRSRLDRNNGRDIRRFLQSVAEADGRVRLSEKAQIRQIATELGLPS
jgi:uncharacterized tellurite resistance protein B-like protein